MADPRDCTRTRGSATTGDSIRGTEVKEDDDTADRRARGLERLAELGDHPGGERVPGADGRADVDWLVDWVFGDVHARPDLGRASAS